VKPVDDRTRIEGALTYHYGVPPHAVEDLRFHRSEGDRVYAASPALEGVDGPAAPLRVERVGMYFATWTEHGLRLGMEAAEVLAPAAEPVFEVSRGDARAWLAGEDLPHHIRHPPRFLILTHDDMVLGCGVALGDEVRNRVPRDRRIGRDASVLPEGPD
jgi:NOL1/NOP2/fmu family ribosome biogenesis protein